MDNYEAIAERLLGLADGSQGQLSRDVRLEAIKNELAKCYNHGFDLGKQQIVKAVTEHITAYDYQPNK